MALKAGTAYVDIAARVSSGFQGDVDKAVTPGLDSVGKKAGGVLSGAVGKAAAVAAGGALAKVGTDFLKGAVDAARESAKIAAQSEQVVKSTGGAAHVSADQMSELAGAIAKKTGVDDEAIQSAENLLATFTNVKNEVGVGNKIFDQATKTITDMSAVQGSLEGNTLLLGKALQDPIKGLAALHRVGVDFNDQQKAQIETMVKAGDVAGAQKVILNELGKEFGGQAEAQATSAGKLSVAWGNVQESIGQKLLPVLEKVAGFLAEHTGLIVPLAGVISGVLVVAFAAWAISAATAAAATIAAAAPILAIIAAVAAVGVAIYLLVKNWDEIWSKIKEIVGAAWEAVKSAVKRGIDFLVDLFLNFTGPGLIIKHFDTIVDFVTKLPGRIASAAAGMWDGIKNAFKAAVNWIIRAWNHLEFKIPGFDPPGPGPKFGGFTLGMPDIPEFRFAGGPATGGRPYIVGEYEPELFVPRTSGGIIPASALDALGAGHGALIGGDVNWYGSGDRHQADDFAARLRDHAWAAGWG